MVPVILEVLVEEEGDSVEVPLTPDTTCRDVIECVRDPGEENCALVHTWGNSQRTLKESERPLEILQQWGPARDQVRFVLRYTLLPGGGNAPRNGMKEPELLPDSLCGGVELTVVELEAMAVRQQEQMASQRELLAAKEQRLRLLKQDTRAHIATEHDRLRRLRDRVEAQELKLQKLRALRGQVDHNKVNNASLTSDLDSIRALFNEKEKELTMAVAKVEELTRQLEEVRRGKAQQAQQPPGQASQELERLRRELMYRNKLNEQQTARLSEQREALCQRQMEMASIDKRIAELQDRLHRKRMLNQQLANQITAASNKANTGNQQNIRSAMQMPGLQQQQMYQGIPSVGKPMMRPVPSGNIAAVEPYHHVPSYTTTNVEQEYMKRQEIKPDQPPQRVYNNTNQDELMGPRKPNLTAPATHHYVHELKKEEKHETENLSEFGASKSDPKYQTLPYNTKFAMNSSPVLKAATKRASGEGNENITENIEAAKHNTINNNHNNNHNNNNFNHINNNVNQLNVAHSIPIQAGANKGLAMALANQKHSPIPSSASSTSSTSSTSSYPTLSHLAPRVYGNNLLTTSLMARGQPVGGASSTTSSTSSLATNSSASSTNGLQKPVSAVPPSLQHSSNIYQTSSTKIHPVQPQTIISTPQVVVKEETETNKPALPPKPAVPAKPTPPPPPRQTQNSLEMRPSIDVSSDAVDSALNVLRGAININTRGGKLNSEYPNQYPVEITEAPPPPPSTEPPSDEPIFNRRTAEPIIKARPLTIKKQPISELPRLRNFIHKDDTVDDKRVNSEDIRRLERNEEDVGLRKVEDGSEESGNGLGYGNSRRIEMPPAYLFPETETPPADLVPQPEVPSQDQTDRSATPEDLDDRDNKDTTGMDSIPRRVRKGNLKGSGEKQCLSRRVSFDPLALLLDASLEGELELVMRTASQVRDPSAANDEGITALHNAICAGHFDIVTFLVKFGCDVNAQDSDGWTPLHCAASCNNVAMVRFLVEHGACIFATTLSDHETAAEKCEEDEEGFDGCSEYLYSVQEKLGIMNSGVVYAVFDYDAHNSDELSFKEGDKLVVLRKGDEWEREWWWARLNDAEGYIPRNLLGLYPRVHANKSQE